MPVQLNIPDSQEERVSKKKFWKFWIVMFLINVGFIVIIARLFAIQVLDYGNYQSKAKRQHESKVMLSAERGNIYDRHHKLLATNLRYVSIAVDPTVLKNEDRLCDLLSETINLSRSALKKKISDAKGSFVWLARSVNQARIKELYGLEEKGLILINEAKRRFPYQSVGAQLIGCTDIDNKGLTGIEFGADSILSGRSGYMIMYRDGLGRLRPSAGLPRIKAVNGHSVDLTIDIDLQRIVEFELEQGVKSTRAYSGTVVIISPNSGEILAMASFPSYNPERIGKSSANWMRNRAVTDVYEPGSTFKVVTAAAALEEKITTRNKVYYGYQGELKFKDYSIKDVHPHGKITFEEAIVQSSNIIFSTIAQSIPDSKFYKYIRDFGFGIVHGIDLPGEVTGTIQKPEDFHSSSKRFMGFGYGISATPLQVLSAFCVIANDGVMMKPYVIKQITGNDGEATYNAVPQKIRRVVSKKTADELTNLLVEVVDRGTGRSAKISGIKIAGKTGTTQQIVSGKYSKKDYTASFAGFFPAGNPKYAMLVLLDKPRSSYYGGSAAAPIFKNIASKWISVKPDAADDGIAHNVAPAEMIVPSLKGLSGSSSRDLLAELGLDFSVTGRNGLVANHSPEAGRSILPGS